MKTEIFHIQILFLYEIFLFLPMNPHSSILPQPISPQPRVKTKNYLAHLGINKGGEFLLLDLLYVMENVL